MTANGVIGGTVDNVLASSGIALASVCRCPDPVLPKHVERPECACILKGFEADMIMNIGLSVEPPQQ